MSYGRIQERVSADSGCFVSKGSISGGSLILYNTQSDILFYIRDLLSKLNIETTGLHFGTKAGTELADPLNGKTYIRNNDCLTLRIRARSLTQFARGVGFTIARKQEKLVEHYRR